eukprot:ANDGO_07951.mRNA.1 Pre-mRNA-processing factor 17
MDLIYSEYGSGEEEGSPESARSATTSKELAVVENKVADRQSGVVSASSDEKKSMCVYSSAGASSRDSVPDVENTATMYSSCIANVVVDDRSFNAHMRAFESSRKRSTLLNSRRSIESASATNPRSHTRSDFESDSDSDSDSDSGSVSSPSVARTDGHGDRHKARKQGQGEGKGEREVHNKAKKKNVDKTVQSVSSRLFVPSTRDYLGMSYLVPPSSLVSSATPSSKWCFLPKRPLQSLEGHSRGVNVALFFPGAGHLLLSASMDRSVRLWDTRGFLSSQSFFSSDNANHHCLRSFRGHGLGVRDVCWMGANPSALSAQAASASASVRFASCGYDRRICIWDPESGSLVDEIDMRGSRRRAHADSQPIQHPNAATSVTGLEPQLPAAASSRNSSIRQHRDTPLCMISPWSEPSTLLVGTMNRNIIQYDLRISPSDHDRMVCTYSEHAGAVNSIAFANAAQTIFVSCSDDKHIRVWERGVPTTIRHIAEPWMQTMPCVVSHPRNEHLLVQSADNSIYVLDVMAHLASDASDDALGTLSDKVRLNRKKLFRGHDVSGFACRPCFSPDGQYVCSGDSRGVLTIWEFSSTRIVAKLKAHGKPLMCVDWNPRATSQVVTAGWDNLIKYWD